MKWTLLITVLCPRACGAFQILSLRGPVDVQRRQSLLELYKDPSNELARPKNVVSPRRSSVSEGAPSKKSTEKAERRAPNARFEAVRALIPGRKGFPVDRLEASKGYRDLSTRDRSFARLLVATVERRQGQIDKVLQDFQNKNPSKSKKTSRVDNYIHCVLRLGAAQLLFLNTPAHAACKETVDLLRFSQDYDVSEGRIKFVNAVLRALTKQGKEVLEQTSLTDNAAPWLLEELTKSYGKEVAESIVAMAMKESPRCLTVRQKPGSSEAERQDAIQNLAEEFSSVCDAEILPQGSIKILNPPSGKVSAWPGYEEGKWFVQDPSATLPAIALYNTLSKQGTESVVGMNVVDLCAAPGGKSSQLCCYGFDVTAIETSSKRCAQLKQNLDRLGLTCNVVEADGTTWIPTEDSKPVRGVLLDAPCTATGTGSRRPDVLHRDSNYTELVDIQYKLACHVVDNVLEEGGVLVYATCSLLQSEGELQMERLMLRKDTDTVLEIIPFEPNEIPGLPGGTINAQGHLRLIPQEDNQVDGFFVCRMKKVR